MIIGINGYIGAGKDTVGSIIQWITLSRGDKSPYSTLQQFQDACSRWENYRGGSYWAVKKFASKLKQIASIITGIPAEKFENQEFKASELPSEWNYMEALPRESLEQENKYWRQKSMTVREFLQRLGTDAIRDGLHANTWVNALFADYMGKPYGKAGVIPFGEHYRVENTGETVSPETHPELFGEWFPHWIITDLRFPNEAQAIKDRGGIIVRLNRMKAVDRIEGVGGTHLHPSETSLDNWDFDYRLNNNSTIEDLILRVREMLLRFKIIEEDEENKG